MEWFAERRIKTIVDDKTDRPHNYGSARIYQCSMNSYIWEKKR